MDSKTMVSDLIDDEVLIIEDGGELPEVTFHASVYYLTSDPEGPGVCLSDADFLQLKLAVVEGYRRIIVRDLMVENRDKGLYRGLERCAANWNRLMSFCQRENLSIDEVAGEVCSGLQHFFNAEVTDVIHLGRPTCINCTAETLSDFFGNVGFDPSVLPQEWEYLVK